MANLVEHTMLNGLEENLKSAIEMAGGEIPADSCVWDYPGIIRDQLSSGGQILKVLPGKGINVERDSKGNYVVSVIEADSTENVKMDTIQAPSYAVGIKNGYWPKGTILQNFLEDLFSKVLPYVPSVLSGEIIIADNEGNDVFGYDEQTKDPQVKNGLDKNNQYLRLNIASQTEPVYISLENLRVKAEDVNVDLSNYYVKSEVDNLIKTSQDELSSNVDEVINNITDRINAHYIKLENLRKDVNSLNEKILTDYYTKDDIDNRLSNLSGNVDLSNYYTKDQINATVDKVKDDVDKIDDEVNDLKLKVATDYYTKDEIKEQISNVKVDLSGYYTKSETDSAINNVKDTVNELKDSIDDVKDYANNLNVKLTTDYYTKSDVYNKPEINSLIDNKISEIEIPEVDLSGYYTKSETDSAINDIIENFQIQTSPESEPVKIVETVVEVTEKVSQQTEQITQVEQTIQKQESQISHVTEQINNIDQTIIETVQNIDAVDHRHSEPVFVEIFGKPGAQVSSKDDLLSQINSSNHIELASNIELVNTPVVVDKTVEVNLNGKEIVGGVFVESNGDILEGNSDSFAFLVKEGANLTISGQGQVKAQDATYSMAVWANGGTVIINDGVYTNEGNGCDLIYASNGGKVYIYGGEFIATSNDKVVAGTKNEHSALNIKDAHRDICEIVVYGGKFYKFNPGDNVSETQHTSFLAPGLKTIKEGDYYIVVKE